jgi:hypothetical protein
MNNQNMLKQFVHSYVYAPFLGTSFLFALLLLFFRDFDSTIPTVFAPALAVYIIGTLLLGYAYAELDRINCVRAAQNDQTPGPQPPYITWIFRSLHGIWFLLLIIYVFCKSLL